MSSKLIESLRGDLVALHKAGAISKVTMRQFDAMCPPPVREFSAADIKQLRERLKFSQPVFAHLLHTTASTVQVGAGRHAARWACLELLLSPTRAWKQFYRLEPRSL